MMIVGERGVDVIGVVRNENTHCVDVETLHFVDPTRWGDMPTSEIMTTPDAPHY
jgi:hypothetical protein